MTKQIQPLAAAAVILTLAFVAMFAGASAPHPVYTMNAILEVR